jgi:RNA polymerase sigma-70 factor (ECF subfamily)
MIRPLLSHASPVLESPPPETPGASAGPLQQPAAGRPRPAAAEAAHGAGAAGLGEGGLGQAAFDAMIARWAPQLLYYLWDMCGEQDLAEDLLQETWLRAWEHRSEVQDEELARAWLYSIATNRLRDHWRRQAIGRRVLGRPVTLSPEIAWQAPPEPMDEALVHALGSLAPEDRQLALLIGIHGFTQREAADVLGLGYETGRKRWQRARDRLEDRMTSEAARMPGGSGYRGDANPKEARR